MSTRQNSKTFLLFIVMLSAFALVFTGCSDGGTTTPSPTNGDPPLSPDLHECTPYVATSHTIVATGNYDAANDKPTGSLTALAEAGGGYIEVSLTTESGTLVPGLQVRAAGDMSGAIISSSAAGTMNPLEKKAGWSVAPRVKATTSHSRRV